MEVGAFVEVSRAAAIMSLANIFSGQKHFTGEVDNWPREEKWKAHVHTGLVLSPLDRFQFRCDIFFQPDTVLKHQIPPNGIWIWCQMSSVNYLVKINHPYTQIVKSLNSCELYPILGYRNTGTLGELGKPKLERGVSEFQVQKRVLLPEASIITRTF